MLEELNILNGYLDLKFDKLNNIYTVRIEENITNLVFNYKVSDGYKVEILNNDNLENLSNVYIKVYNDIEENIYTFTVYKELSNTTSLIENYKNSLNIPEDNVSTKDIYSILIGCIIVILFFAYILLKPRKKN